MHLLYWILALVVSAGPTTQSGAQKTLDIQTLFVQLNQLKTTDHAASEIVKAASKDPSAREYIVQRLPDMIDKREPENAVWQNAVRLAGQLKVVETIASLLKALPLGAIGGPQVTTFGIQGRLEDDIVAKALSEMGDSAIPSVLSLLQTGDVKTRRRAVLILTNIGSTKARKVLHDRLAVENDPHIKDLIKTILTNLAQESPPKS